MGQKKPEHEQNEEMEQSRWGFRGMTVRNWLELLIVPVVLVAIGLLFEMQQTLRQEATEKHQLALAGERADDDALQAYLDEVGRLMLEKELSDPNVKTILRARTIAVLGRLAPSGKTALMQFLVEADLVQGVEGRDPTISLRGADLREVYLPHDANLHGTVLRNANLSDAHLTDTVLSDAHLSDAHLTDASGITNEELEQQAASLAGATMPTGQKYEDWIKDKKAREEGG